MKFQGRLRLLLLLLLAAGLGMLSYHGIGAEKMFSASRIEQGLDLSGGLDIMYEADREFVTESEMNAAVSLLQGRMD